MNATMQFKVYRDSRREWRWSLKARNGRIVADSAEGYKRRATCLAQVVRIKAGAALAKVVVVVVVG